MRESQKFVDLFCGMGTIRMGFEQAGWECVYSVEFDKHKREIYKVIFGNEPEGRDIKDVRSTDIPKSDCWCFGAPCQDFSIAGKRAGLTGGRSGMVREVFRLLREIEKGHRPEWLLYENVKGMLSSNKGLDYLEILYQMGCLGYDVQWQIINSKDFGVPQNRERVYTLGHLRAKGTRKIFPIGESDGETAELQGQTSISNTITARYQNAANGTYVLENKRQTQVKQIGNVMPTTTRVNPNQGRVYDSEGLAPCLNKMGGGGREPLITEPCACLTPDRLEKRQNGRRFKKPGEPMFTLTKQDIHGVAYGVYTNDSPQFHQSPLKEISRSIKSGNHDTGVAILRQVRNEYGKKIRKDYENGKIQENRNKMTRLEPRQDGISNTVDTVQKDNLLQTGARIRRLTPRECMRLQGVSDYITDKLIAAGISDTQMYRAAGDACTVNVIYEIAKQLNASGGAADVC